MTTSYPRSVLRPRWWETASGILRPYLKSQGVTLNNVTGQLDELKAQGFDTLEIFAPCKGGVCYNGLDSLDFYEIDPAIGSMDDFKTPDRRGSCAPDGRDCLHQPGLRP